MWAKTSSARRSIRLIFPGTGADPTTTSAIVWSSAAVFGFQASSMLPHYSALPFNITSGVTTVQGTAARPVVDGAFIERNAGVGSDFFSMSLRLSRTFRIAGKVRLEGLVEAFNLTNRRNDLTRIRGSSRSGRAP